MILSSYYDWSTNGKIALLYHLLHWEATNDYFPIDKGITLHKTENTNVEILYHKLCEEVGVDEATPYDYYTHLIYDNEIQGPSDGNYSSPENRINFINNLLAINLHTPISFVRIMKTRDDFKTCSGTKQIFYYSESYDFFNTGKFTINDDTLLDIKKCYDNLKNINFKNADINYITRINCALRYFFYSWSSYHVEQTCVNLAVAIESLFSPSQSEVNHQIAFNICKFVGRDKEERQRVYKLMKDFYDLRSKIVHGSLKDYRKFYPILFDSFYLFASMLRDIIINEELLEIFNDNKQRENYLQDLIFR